MKLFRNDCTLKNHIRKPDPPLKRYAITLVFLYAGSTRVPLPLLTWQTPPLILILLSTAKSIFRKKKWSIILHDYKIYFFPILSFSFWRKINYFYLYVKLGFTKKIDLKIETQITETIFFPNQKSLKAQHWTWCFETCFDIT